jgi:periplasmic protein TonB
MNRTPQKARSIMERRLFDTGFLPRKRQRAITLPVSIAIHAAVVSAALMVPVLADKTLPEVSATGPVVDLMAPPPPPAAAPPRIDNGPRVTAGRQKLAPVVGTRVVAPPEIPDFIPQEDPLPGSDPSGGPGDGVVGGADWGARNGAVIGGLPKVPTAVMAPMRVSVMHGPRKLHHVPPVYPEVARSIHLQGTVVVECTIDARGRVVNAAVVQGNPLLNDAAKAAVEQWVYTPTLLNGVPVPVLMQVSVTFMIS